MIQRTAINNRMQQERKRDNGYYVAPQEQKEESKIKATKKCHIVRANRTSLKIALAGIDGFCK